MKTYAKTGDSSLARLLRRKGSRDLEIIRHAPAWADIRISQAAIRFHGEDELQAPHRPWLWMTGQAESVNYADTVELPTGIEEYIFAGRDSRHEERELQVDIAYEFDDDQLIHLIRAGLFSGSFEMPEALRQGTIQVPVLTDLFYERIQPDTRLEDVVCFITITNRYDVQVSLEKDGLDLAGLFESVPQGHKSAGIQSREVPEPVHEVIEEQSALHMEYVDLPEEPVSSQEDLYMDFQRELELYDRKQASLHLNEEIKKTIEEIVPDFEASMQKEQPAEREIDDPMEQPDHPFVKGQKEEEERKESVLEQVLQTGREEEDEVEDEYFNEL